MDFITNSIVVFGQYLTLTAKVKSLDVVDISVQKAVNQSTDVIIFETD
ncbi:hypothetical protein MD535_16430 [Vibrio sp. ZSDZ65]|uniref:Uncharacterized protein n=1 Tax=Vibrio qingdaonensis TaxID=2829491 RepID=A0A9X3CR20_9VIBR|nr:hypothetical protein [Vibrio qingdaonensis]MCW8347589.1 hypothetical protein [Vibrio qingdaonensis]